MPEQRAWDAMIVGPDGDVGVELEIRLYDMQAQARRIFRKWRDSGAARLLVLINDTRANRAVLWEFDAYFGDLPRLRTAAVVKMLATGQLPPSGHVLI